MSDYAVSVVIPVLNAAPYLPGLLAALAAQRPSPPDEIILVDSCSTDATTDIAAAHAGVRCIPIHAFSHGRARNLGARAASGEIVVFLSQDALPRDAEWLDALLRPFANGEVAAAYSRQVPREDANPMECFFLQKRFPEQALVRRRGGPGWQPSLEGVFFSNVSAAVRRAVLLEHPFDETLIMSEDQQLSRDLMRTGYAVAYAPDSVVIHSHCYRLTTAFRRYFDSVYSLACIFSGHDVRTSVSMGRSYVREECAYILRHHAHWAPYYAVYTFNKALATLLAHHAERLPRWLLRRMSLHRYHWDDSAASGSTANVDEKGTEL